MIRRQALSLHGNDEPTFEKARLDLTLNACADNRLQIHNISLNSLKLFLPI